MNEREGPERVELEDVVASVNINGGDVLSVGYLEVTSQNLILYGIPFVKLEREEKPWMYSQDVAMEFAVLWDESVVINVDSQKIMRYAIKQGISRFQMGEAIKQLDEVTSVSARSTESHAPFYKFPGILPPEDHLEPGNK